MNLYSILWDFQDLPELNFRFKPKSKYFRYIDADGNCGYSGLKNNEIVREAKEL